jgi:Protein of unknown function (DUF3108)
MGSPGFQDLLLEMKLRRLVSISFICLILAIVSLSVRAQTLAMKPATKPFEPGEELIYKAEVSRSLLRKIDVANFKFTIDPTPTKKADDLLPTSQPRPTMKLVGDVASTGFFMSLFKIHFHQHVESTVDAETLAIQKTVKLDEQGKRVRESVADFDQQHGKVVWTEHDPNDPVRTARTASSDFTGPIHDVVSAIYYLRTQPLSPGNSFEVPISDSGRVYRVPVRVVEKKRMKTALGRVNVVRVDPELLGQRGMVNAKGQFSIWLTDDRRHIPVLAQLKSEFGTFDITLKKVSHQSSRLALRR